MTASDVCLLLRLEHQNFAKLLDILARQLETLDQDGQLDYSLVESIFDYFQGYPDECHHPKEDLVFRKLEARSAAAADKLTNLVAEHEELASLTARTAEQVRQARGENLAPDEPLESGLRRFLESYRRHMVMEEKYFFKAAEQVLSRSDWDEIEFDLFDRKDPVFDEAVEHRFESLRQQIGAMDQRR